MKVQSAMHKGVEWVGPDTPVTELAKLMRQHDVGSFEPVTQRPSTAWAAKTTDR